MRDNMKCGPRETSQENMFKNALYIKVTARAGKASCQVERKRWRLICDKSGQQVPSCLADYIYSDSWCVYYQYMFCNES